MLSTFFKPSAKADQGSDLVPLSQLRCKEQGVIVDVDAAPIENARLAEMGLTVGSDVQVLCGGRTRLFRVGGSRLSLRSDDLDAILVERLA